MPKDMVGLVRCMYGTRDAGAIWEQCYAKCLIDLGFTQGTASPCCFSHKICGAHVVVHEDNFTALGTLHGLDMYERGMAKSFKCKFKGRLGHGQEDFKEMMILNRIVRVTESGLRYEADPRLAAPGVKPMVAPGVKLPFDESAPTDDSTDNIVEDLDAMVAATAVRKREVSFSSSVRVHEVPYQHEVYGKHPRTFYFNSKGQKVRRVRGQKEEHTTDPITVSDSSSPNLRRSI